MSARKRSKEKTKAQAFRIQETVHQLLYCETREIGIYHTQFVRSVERARISFDEIDDEIVKEIEKEFQRRINRKAEGREPFGRDLIFYQILQLCLNKKTEQEIILSIDQPENCIYENIDILVRINLLSAKESLYSTTPKGRKLYSRLSST